MTVKHEQIPYEPGKKETSSTRQYIEGNIPKEIDSNQQKKEKTKIKKEILSDENRKNKERQKTEKIKSNHQRDKKRCKGKDQEIKKDKKQTQRLQNLLPKCQKVRFKN